jgi:methionyl-tRNA formyltransferase
MRIAYFHNWATPALGCALLSAGKVDVCLIGPPTPESERDPKLLELAEHRGARTVAVDDIGSEKFFQAVVAFAPDLIVVSVFPKKLPRALLEIPRLAAVNVHWSLLPAYRGAAPEFWALRNGEDRTGVTVHLMTERFDAGRILAQQAIPLAADENLTTISVKLEQASVPLVMALIERYRFGDLPVGDEQDEALATSAPVVRAHHLEVQWSETASSIECLTRACFPCLRPHTRFRGKKLVVREVQCLDRSSPRLGPGELFYDPEAQQLLAGTGSGLLLLKVLEFHEMTTDGPCLGPALSPGERLG